MIPHHFTQLMIGRTLQSTLVIVYRRYRHTSNGTGGDGRLLATSSAQQGSRQTDNTQAMAESQSQRPTRLIRGFVICGFYGHVSSCHRSEREREREVTVVWWGGASQQAAARVWGRRSAGVELSGGSHPCKTELWEAGQVEEKRSYLSKLISCFWCEIYFSPRWFSIWCFLLSWFICFRIFSD